MAITVLYYTSNYVFADDHVSVCPIYYVFYVYPRLMYELKIKNEQADE